MIDIGRICLAIRIQNGAEISICGIERAVLCSEPYFKILKKKLDNWKEIIIYTIHQYKQTIGLM